MALKAIFNAMKNTDGYVLKKLDMYLLSLNDKDGDRAIDVNAPSQVGACKRAIYYARLQYPSDGSIDPRTRRIFDNGSFTHLRLQEYLAKCGILISDEVPCINEKLNIQGHTDGFLNLGTKTETTIKIPKGKFIVRKTVPVYSDIGILEIKSINSNGFANLKTAREDHQQQAMVYLYCSEERRKYLRKTYKNHIEFIRSEKEREAFFRSRFEHIKDGSKYTREEKIANQLKLCLETDTILFNAPNPITKVIFIYENKDNQEIKEYCVERDNALLEDVIAKYETINEAVANKQIPDREGTSKSCATCRYCNYKLECFC